MLGKRGSVMVFLRGIPENLTRKELKAFIMPAVRTATGRSVGLKGAVSGCTILRMTDPQSGATEFHGLVEIHPAKVAIHAIAELNGKKLGGQRIEVRRYQPRSALRAQSLEVVADEVDPGTARERRRNLKIDLVNA